MTRQSVAKGVHWIVLGDCLLSAASGAQDVRYDVLLASRAKASILKNNPLDVRMLHTVPIRMLDTGSMQISSRGAIWKSGKMQTTTFYRLENGVCCGGAGE